MSAILWISGGHVVDPASGRDAPGDVFAVNGRFVENLDEAQKQAADHFDASGLKVAPGFVDVHVHFREPGQTQKETIATGSRAAAAGGYTSVVCMPNTSPVCDNAGTIQLIREKALREAVVHVYPSGCITLGAAGRELAPTGSLRQAGVVAITDDGRCVQNNELMRRALEYARMFDLPIMDHCQDASMTAGAVMNEGAWSLRLGLGGWPREAEDIVVARNAILAELTGARVHIQHVSSANAVDIVRRAKERGAPLTAEGAPHHLRFTDACLAGYDTDFKMNPPLRTDADREAIAEGLLDGTLDCVATDHAPHTPTDKDAEFDYAPFGVIGLENAFASVLGDLYHTGRASLAHVVDLMTRRAAGICRLEAGTLAPGAPADCVLFDPDEEWTLDPEQLQSKARNCPWRGETLKGRVKRTFVGGRQAYDGIAITAPRADA